MALSCTMYRTRIAPLLDLQIMQYRCYVICRLTTLAQSAGHASRYYTICRFCQIVQIYRLCEHTYYLVIKLEFVILHHF